MTSETRAKPFIAILIKYLYLVAVSTHNGAIEFKTTGHASPTTIERCKV